MTPAHTFAAWLGPAMRRANLDIDTQQGGGRVALANACQVSRSTVSRWLEGQSMPSPEYFEAIAEALNVPVVDMLVGASIISASSLRELQQPDSPANAPSVEEVAAEWGILPEDRELFFAVAEQLRKRARPTA